MRTFFVSRARAAVAAQHSKSPSSVGTGMCGSGRKARSVQAQPVCFLSDLGHAFVFLNRIFYVNQIKTPALRDSTPNLMSAMILLFLSLSECGYHFFGKHLQRVQMHYVAQIGDYVFHAHIYKFAVYVYALLG